MRASPEELWARLATAGLTVGHTLPAAVSPTPWYVRLMLCIAGCLAALFLLGFVGVGLTFLMDDRSAAMAMGIVLIAGAFAIFRTAPRSDFGAMFALAVSLAGQALFIFGFLRFETGAGAGAWLAIAALEALLALLMPNYIHRVISAFGAALASMYASIAFGTGFLSGALACAVASLWLNEARLARRQSVTAPIGYGLTLALIHVEAMPSFGWILTAGAGMHDASAWGAPWTGELLTAAALVATAVTLAKRAGSAWGDGKMIVVAAAATLIGLVSLKAPGVAAGLMIALLGHANGNRVLLGLGVMSLIFYGSAYYYLLAVTLLVKAAVLAATGFALLAVRTIVLTTLMPERRRRA
jgi:uncharacterized membrane protein